MLSEITKDRMKKMKKQQVLMVNMYTDDIGLSRNVMMCLQERKMMIPHHHIAILDKILYYLFIHCLF